MVKTQSLKITVLGFADKEEKEGINFVERAICSLLQKKHSAAITARASPKNVYNPNCMDVRGIVKLSSGH